MLYQSPNQEAKIANIWQVYTLFKTITAIYLVLNTYGSHLASGKLNININ